MKAVCLSLFCLPAVSKPYSFLNTFVRFVWLKVNKFDWLIPPPPHNTIRVKSNTLFFKDSTMMICNMITWLRIFPFLYNSLWDLYQYIKINIQVKVVE